MMFMMPMRRRAVKSGDAAQKNRYHLRVLDAASAISERLRIKIVVAVGTDPASLAQQQGICPALL
jgi:hypothetical protein